MALLDHFHAPLFPNRSWESFHSRWANSLADALNRDLPGRYFAEVQLHLGSQVEADVAEWDGQAGGEPQPDNGRAAAVATRSWSPPAASFVLPALFPDDLEVQVRDARDDARLAAVVELVSPRNKDRPDSRRALVAKCAAYLQRGIGVLVLDIVTGRQINLHNELVTWLYPGQPFAMPDEATLYAVSYGPCRRGDNDQIEVWAASLAVGEPLPVLPLALRGSGTVPLDLDATYEDACQRSRL